MRRSSWELFTAITSGLILFFLTLTLLELRTTNRLLERLEGGQNSVIAETREARVAIGHLREEMELGQFRLRR
jgi:hypothetical protein